MRASPLFGSDDGLIRLDKTRGTRNFRRQLVKPGVAVESSLGGRRVETTLQQEDAQTTISVLADIFHFPNFDYFDKAGFFNSHSCLHVLTNYAPDPLRLFCQP